jgi:hypothetical protein
VTVGHPASRGVRMGPVVSLEQRDEVRRAARAIAESGRLVHGDPAKVQVIDADPQRGAFLDTILISADPEAQAPHEVEPFGPVASVLGYRDATHAAELLARAGAAWRPPSSVTTCRGPRESSPKPRRGTDGCTCSTAPTWSRQQATARRCRRSSTAAPAGPAEARKWPASVASSTLCNGPPSRRRQCSWPPCGIVSIPARPQREPEDAPRSLQQRRPASS